MSIGMLAGCGANTTNKKDIIKEMENKLQNIERKDTIAAALINAEEGVRFNLKDSTRVEIYRFNKKEIEKLKETNKIKIEGLGEIPVVINGNYVLLDFNVPKEIADLFKSL